MDYSDCNAAELTAVSLIETILERGGEALYDRYLEAKVRPVTLKWVLGQVSGLVELEFCRRDVGEEGEWKGEEDATPIPKDSWARACVAIKTVLKDSAVIPPPFLPPTPLSLLSSRSSSLPDLPRPPIYLLSSAIDIPDPVIDQLRSRKEQQAIKEKAELSRQKAAQLIREENRRRLERAAFDLRNSQFTYDYEGNIILVKPKEVTEGRKVHAKVKSLPETPKLKRGMGVKRPVNVVKPTPVAELHFVKSVYAMQTIMDLVKVREGVTAIESGKIKKALKSDGKPWEETTTSD